MKGGGERDLAGPSGGRQHAAHRFFLQASSCCLMRRLGSEQLMLLPRWPDPSLVKGVAPKLSQLDTRNRV